MARHSRLKRCSHQQRNHRHLRLEAFGGILRPRALRIEPLESRVLLSVVVSDSFVRANAGPLNLGVADLAYGGSGTNYYLPLFPTAGNPANPVGADLANDALQNYSMNYGGVELTASNPATDNAALGENIGQNLDLQANILVPHRYLGRYFRGGALLPEPSQRHWRQSLLGHECRILGQTAKHGPSRGRAFGHRRDRRV